MSNPPNDYEVIGSAVTAALFNYQGIPGNIGIDLDPSIGKGLQSMAGALVGLLAVDFLYNKESFTAQKISWKKMVFGAGIAGVVSYLLFPDNQMLQSGIVFLVPVMHNWTKIKTSSIAAGTTTTG